MVEEEPWNEGGRGVESIDVALVCRDVGRPELPPGLEYRPLVELGAVDPLIGVVGGQSRMLLLRTGKVFSSISSRFCKTVDAVSKLRVLWWL